MKKSIFGVLALLSLQCGAQTLPFSKLDLEKAIDVTDINDYVYILKDIDGDNNPELFVKEKEKKYNNHYGLVINNGKPQLVVSRETSSYTEYGYTDDGYFYTDVESGYGNNYNHYWKLKNSKVVLDFGRTEDASTENITVEFNFSEGPNTQENYDANRPKGGHNSFYNLEGWKEFPFDKTCDVANTGVKSELTPAGWTTTNVEADFNKDGIQDLALVTYKSDRTPTIAIYFGQANGQYKLFAKSKQFHLKNGTKISVNAKGVITIRVEDGDTSNDKGYTRYLFRYQNGDFYLIGKEENSFNSTDNTTSQWSYNYPTKKCLYRKTGQPDKWEDIKGEMLKFTEVTFY